MIVSAFKRNSTTLAIYHTLVTILETNNFDELTVNDICQEALISRTTFYSYFEDKFHLIMFFFEEERNKLGVIRGIDMENNLLKFLERIKENKLVYKNLLVSNVNQELHDMIAFGFKETILSIIQPLYTEEESEILAQFYTGGMTFVVMTWIENDCKKDEALITKTLFSQFPGRERIL